MDHIQINSLRLNNFRNYSHLDILFNQQINLVTGLNGAGKTSILDAVYYLANGKSYFSHLDGHIYKRGENFFRLEASFSIADSKYQLTVQSSDSRPKQIQIDEKAVKAIVEHIGRFPAFMIAPKDILILIDSSVERRRLIDKTISQVDKTYLKQLLNYNKLLKQRNAALKGFLKISRRDELIIDAFDNKLFEPAKYIYEKRKAYIQAITPIVNAHYSKLSSDREKIDLTYKSKLYSSEYTALMQASREKDYVMGKTHEGIHKDDLRISLGGHDIRKIGSQGQLKSAIIAIKLAQAEWVRDNISKVPILLLDDIFDKLDKERVRNLIDICSRQLQAQFFITDTDEERITAILDVMQLDYTHFKIENGSLVNAG